MNIGIITTYSPQYDEIAKITLANKQEYCDLHGYTLVRDEGTIDYTRPLNWTKVPAIRDHLNAFDWVFWSDIDSIIVDMERKLENYIVEDVSLIAALFKIARDPGHMQSAIDKRLLAYTLHTGNFFIKNDSIGHRIVNYLHNNEQWRTHDLMDEAALTDFYRNCTDIRSRTKLCMIRELCTVPEGNMMQWIFPVYSPGDFIVHFLGKDYTMEQKLEQITTFIRKYR